MKISLLALILLLFSSCGVESNKEYSGVIANASCVLSIEGMMCEKGCKTTIQQKLSNTNGVVACAVEYEEKKVVIDFDNNFVTTKELIKVVDEIAGGIYKASLLDEGVFIQEAGFGTAGSSNESDVVSVSDYGLQLPDFSSIFSNLL
ncbi:cation transporter [Flavobacteriales bacterium]|nr:cation transporter [Flavobacteriales bacterium]